MKLEDLGIDSKTGRHDKTLTYTENCFLGLLWIDHVGEDNKIGADELTIMFRYALEGRMIPKQYLPGVLEDYRWAARRELDLLKRDVRRMHNHLLTQHDHTPILSKAGNGGGYWIADSEEEAEKFYDSFRQRGLTGLVKASRGKKAIMVEMMTQLSFEFEDLIDKSGIRPDVRGQRSDVGRDGPPAAIAVVDAFLERMLRNPEKYAADLRKIGAKFGSVLLPKKSVAAMQAKAQELQAILSELTV
jgi:hypothetical protein